MATFNEVSKFLSQYIDNDGKPVEAITSFIYVNEEKIQKDIEIILDFIANNILFMHEDGCALINLTKDLDGNTWNNLSNEEEYEVLEQLIAICFKIELLREDFNMRLYLPALLGDKCASYIEGQIADEEEFLNIIINNVLPNYIFSFDPCMLAGFMKPLELTDDDIKYFLRHWFYYYSHEPFLTTDSDYFNEVLDKRLESVLSWAVNESVINEGSTLTVQLCRIRKYEEALVDAMNKLEKKINKNMTKEEKSCYDEYMEDRKNAFLNMINLTFEEKYHNNGRKYE